jgi:hypothetical protein
MRENVLFAAGAIAALACIALIAFAPRYTFVSQPFFFLSIVLTGMAVPRVAVTTRTNAVVLFLLCAVFAAVVFRRFLPASLANTFFAPAPSALARTMFVAVVAGITGYRFVQLRRSRRRCA